MTAPSNSSASAVAPGADAPARSRAGLLYGIGAYSMWGFFPIYFHVLAHVSPLIVLCHRILQSAFFLAVVVSWRREWRSLAPLLRQRRNLLLLLAGAILLSSNWLVFIYAVGTRQVLETSLGYFINPLLSVALGMIFLREKLRRWQWLAVGTAVFAVANLAIRGSGFPWIAVSLAATFGFYGLVRKKVDVNSLHALLVESTILAPLAALLLFVLPENAVNAPTLGLLSLSGILTATPLLCFGAALRRLKLSTMGFLQYIGPSLQFLVAVVLFHEPLDPAKLLSFILCWVALAIYAIDSLLASAPQPVSDRPE